MSAAGRYSSPLSEPGDWSAQERRSSDPIARLSRRIDRLCVEASDHYEIAAHLEALGLNAPETCRSYGVPDHFELARRLFELTPRRRTLQQSRLRSSGSLVRQLIVVFTLLVTVALGLLNELSVWAPVLVLMTWSQVGAGLTARAPAELAADDERSLVATLSICGVCTLAVLWFFTGFGLAAWTVSLLWLSTAALLWAQLPLIALLPPATTGTLLLAQQFDLIEMRLALTVAASLALIFTLPSMRQGPSGAVGEWIWRERRYLAQLLLYGAGQGLLMFGLLDGTDGKALPGLLLFALVLLTFEPILVRLRRRLSLLMWRIDDPDQYIRGARKTFALFGLLYLLPLALTGLGWALGLPESWIPFLFEYALFALAATLAVTLLTLRELRLPALVFLAGGLAALLGAPLIMTLVIMATLQLVAMWWHFQNLGSYGIHLV